jgi:hypothetical protein
MLGCVWFGFWVRLYRGNAESKPDEDVNAGEMENLPEFVLLAPSCSLSLITHQLEERNERPQVPPPFGQPTGGEMLVLPPRSLQPSFLSHPSEEPCSFLLSSEFCPVRARRPLIAVVLCTAWFPMDKFSDAVCFRPSGNSFYKCPKTTRACKAPERGKCIWSTRFTRVQPAFHRGR